MKEETDKKIALFKIKKIKDYADYIQKELECDLLPNKYFIDEMIELLIDLKRGANYGR